VNQPQSQAQILPDEIEDVIDTTTQDVDVIDTSDNTRSILANLTYDELTVPIASYDKQATTLAMEAAYLRAVQKKLPTDNSKTVGDVFTNDDLRALRDKHVTTARGGKI
jgi:hypothetical protein